MTQTETASIAPVGEIPAVVDPAETQLVDEVRNLWLVHSEAQSSLNKTRDELKLLRTELSQRLHALKAVLSRPGRGGAWSSFLVSQSIPRSSADRLVRGHAKTISAEPDNCADEQIKEPTEVAVRRYAHAHWPRLSKVLTTRESVQVFTAELLRISERSFAGSSSLGSSTTKTSDLPSYLRHLNLPVSAVSANSALA